MSQQIHLKKKKEKPFSLFISSKNTFSFWGSVWVVWFYQVHLPSEGYPSTLHFHWLIWLKSKLQKNHWYCVYKIFFFLFWFWGWGGARQPLPFFGCTPESINQKRHVGGIFSFLVKAFDCINYKHLLAKLHLYDSHGVLWASGTGNAITVINIRVKLVIGDMQFVP